MPTKKPAGKSSVKTAVRKKATTRKGAAKKPVAVIPLVTKAPAKVGLATQLAAIQARYRRAMLDVGDHPDHEQGDRIRAVLKTLLAEKVALGVKDGEEESVVEPE